MRSQGWKLMLVRMLVFGYWGRGSEEAVFECFGFVGWESHSQSTALRRKCFSGVVIKAAGGKEKFRGEEAAARLNPW